MEPRFKTSQASKSRGATSKYLPQVKSTHWPYSHNPKLADKVICIQQGQDHLRISLNIMTPPFSCFKVIHISSCGFFKEF